MENYKKYSMQNSELILKPVEESKDPLSFLNDATASYSSAEALAEFEVVLKGKSADNYEVGDAILCVKNRTQPIPHRDFQGLVVLANQLAAFCKVNKSDATSN